MFRKIQNHLLILMTMNSRGVEDVSENPKSFINFVRHPQDESWCTWPPARNSWTAATRTTPRSVPALLQTSFEGGGNFLCSLLMTMNSRGVEDVSENQKSFIKFDDDECTGGGRCF